MVDSVFHLMSKLEKIAVIGAGTMGAGIAGQIANAGHEVMLLDLHAEGDKPNAVAEAGYRRLLDPNQPGLMSRDAGERIRLGNLRDDFAELAGCDWVAEAVVERLDVKRGLYRRLDETCGERTIITSNTSTIPIRLLTEGMGDSFCRRFAVTHFFNPVRFMRLLELVGSDRTDPAVLDLLDDFCERELGKGVVRCGDTPGFLANRVGVYTLQLALHKAVEMGLSAGEADAIFGRPMGLPKTGVFGLYDLIGIDLMADVARSLVSILPQGDAFHAVSAEIPLMQDMIRNGQTGNKRGKGFYRVDENGIRNELNRGSGEYEPFVRPQLPLADEAERLGIGRLLDDDSLYGRFAWEVLSNMLVYAASLVPAVTEDPVAIDDAMKLGYNWTRGPFELLDELGTGAVASRLESEGRAMPDYLDRGRSTGFYSVRGDRLGALGPDGTWLAIRRPQDVVRFSETRRLIRPENTTASASWYAHDDMAIVEFHSKANVLGPDSMAILADAMANTGPMGHKGLLVHNDAQHFSCGVDLGMVRQFIDRDDMDGLDSFLDHFQRTVMALKNAPYPVVAAPVGLSIGGGFEVVLHARRVICHANSVMGLVESGVGLIPSGGGCKETLYRWIEKLGCKDDIEKACWRAFMNIGYGKTAASPVLAVRQAMLRDNDGYEMNRDRIYSAARQAVRTGEGQKALERKDLSMPGHPLFDRMAAWLDGARADGKLMPHDVAVGTEIARIVSGGGIDPGTRLSEQDFLDSERRSFLRLSQTRATRERIEGLLDSGKTIRN